MVKTDHVVLCLGLALKIDYVLDRLRRGYGATKRRTTSTNGQTGIITMGARRLRVEEARYNERDNVPAAYCVDWWLVIDI